MSLNQFTQEVRARLACSTAAIMAMPQLLDAIETEVAATFAEHPTLPQTEQARRILWALALPKFSGADRTGSQETENQKKTA